MTIVYDPEKTDAAKLAKVITALDYGASEVPVADTKRQELEPAPATLPAGAPESFATAFRRARAAGKPMLLDFGATWCAPCVKFERETLASPDVLGVLEAVELIQVDVDAAPLLAKAYAVTSVPNIVFVDSRGNITGRLEEFEEPGPFAARLRNWIAGGEAAATIGLETSIPSEQLAKAMGLTNNVRVHGRMVDEVEAGGAAALAGLQAGDVLLRLGPNDLYSADDIADLLSVSSPGDRLVAIFKRPGETQQLEATVTLSRGARRAAPPVLWQYAGLGQLPRALEVAKAQKKKVMVGLSGAET